MFIVLMESHDKHKYEFSCDTNSRNEAIIKALESIEGKGWDVYGYEIKEIKEVK